MKKASPDEYEDEGFEDYDEDFEDDSEPVMEASSSSSSRSKVLPPSNANQSITPTPFIAQPKSNNVISSLSKSDTKPTLNRSGDAKSNSNNNNNTIRTDSKPVSMRVKKYDSMQISFTQSITDSRGARMRKLLDSGVLDMQMERVTIWNVPPTTPYDFYINNLRSSTSNVKQVGIPMDLEKRDISTETEPIDTADKGLQFTYGDDTDFYDLLQEVKDSREHHGKGSRADGSGSGGKINEVKQGRSGAVDSDSVVHNEGVESASSSSSSSFDIGATRLTSFLQRASFLCEAVLQDQEINTNGKASLEVETKKKEKEKKEDSQIFDSSSEWKQFGTDYTKGANETIRFRSISYLRFSSLQPNLVISAHPYPTDEAVVNEDELDFKPYKGLYCMWDVSSPSVPLYLLSATGQPTCCCFSNSQSHIVIGGTNEGSLHLWDLRENSSLHKDRDVEELRIERGLRKPCYSTSLSYVSGIPSSSSSSSSSGEVNTISDDWQGHSTSILQVESLSSYDSSVNASSPSSSSSSSSFPSEQGAISQFVSIDESGLVIFWITSNRHKVTSTAHDDDLQRSPWSGIVLMQTRQIDTNRHILYTPRSSADYYYSSPSTNKKQQSGSSSSSNSSSSSSSTEEGVLLHVSDKSIINKGCPVQGNASFAIIPHDVSTLLVYRSEGSIFKVSRFGHPDPPHILQRVRTNHTDIDIVENNDIISSSSSSRSKSGKHKESLHNKRNPEINYFSPVSCMHVRPPIASTHRVVDNDVDVAHDKAESKKKNEEDDRRSSSSSSHTTNSMNNISSTSPLMLVGRFDGTVDLFELDTEHPIQSWNLVDLSIDTQHHQSSNKKDIKSVVVVMVRWCPNRAASFFVADSNGLIYYFDLNRYSSKPVYIEAVTVASSLSTGCIDLSTSSCLRHGGGGSSSSDGQQFNIIFSVKNKKSNGDSIKCKQVNRNIVKQTGVELSHEEKQFRASLHNLSVNKIIAQSVTFIPDVSNNDSK